MSVILAAWGFLKRIPWWIYAGIALVAFHYIDRTVYAHRKVEAATIEINKSWQKRETKMLQDAADRVAKIEAENRAKEANWQREMDDVQRTYQQQLAQAKAQRDRDVARARDGALVLRLPASVCSGSGFDPQAGAGGAGDSRPEAGQLPLEAGSLVLPPDITADLYALADDADEVVHQLTACQAALINERKAAP